MGVTLSEPPDFREIAGRYLDLWQDEANAAFNNPVWAGHVLTVLDFLAQMGVARPVGHHEDRVSRGTDRAAGTKAVGSPSSDSSGKFDELLRRVSGLEERLGLLESNDRESGGSAGRTKRTNRRGPAKTPSRDR